MVKAVTSVISIICIICFIIMINITKAKTIVISEDFFKISGIQQGFNFRDIVKVDAYKRYMIRIENIIVLKIYFKDNERIVEIPINNYKKRDALSFLVKLNNMNIVNTLNKGYRQNIKFTDECKLIIGTYYNLELK